MYDGAGGMTFGIGLVLGPVIGGAFSDSSATWRWAFYINLIIGGVFSPVLLFILKPMNPRPNLTVLEKVKAIDWVGTFLNAATYCFFVMAFTFGGAQWAWSAGGTITFIVLFVVTGLVYAVQQTFAIFTTPQNRIFPVDFLKHRTQWLLHVNIATGATALFIPLYYIPIYYQFVHAEGGIQSAVRLLPFIIITVVGLGVNGTLMPVFGYYMPWYVVSAVFQIIGGALFFACVDANTSNSTIYGFSVLVAIGASIAQQGSYSVSSFKVGLERASDAVCFINVGQIGGVMIALTITSAVFQNNGFRYLRDALAGQSFDANDIHAALAGQKSRIFLSASPEVRTKAIDAIVRAINDGYILVITGGALSLVTSLLMKREKLFMQ